MAYLKLNVPPGIVQIGSAYENPGRWWDGCYARWTAGGKLGFMKGWKDRSGSDLNTGWSGIPCRGLTWKDTTGTVRAVFGTRANTTTYPNGTPTMALYYGGTQAATGSLTTITPATISGPLVSSNWSFDNFGSLLVACVSDSGAPPWSWDPATPATLPVALSGAGAPTKGNAVVVTPERFLFVLGANGNYQRVVWASQETLNVWNAASTNSAGDFDLTTNGKLVAGVRLPRETLLFTDRDVWSAIYIGGTLVYRFEQRGTQCGAYGINSMVVVEDRVYWWGSDGFFVYDGAVRQLDCDVWDMVTGTGTKAMAAGSQNYGQPHALVLSEQNEVYWFYRSVGAGNPSQTQDMYRTDRYVSYNHQLGVWSAGQLNRQLGIDRGDYASNAPLWIDDNRKAYWHEQDTGRDNAPASAYIESAPIELGNGDTLLMVRQLVPDATDADGILRARIYSSMYPNATETLSGQFVLTSPTDIRITARQVRFRIEETGVTSTSNVKTKIGAFRLEVTPASGR